MMRSARTSIIAVLIVAILATAGTRYWADDYRHSVLNRGQVVIADSSQSLANMSSYALALLLGGLRGPLVMMLWISSENQKADKNLEDFDTKVEWIRMLQPEFDSVHMFEIWNKAYNISVQMASLANKYTTILDALHYADEVNRQRPNDINIVMAIADVYFNKLGNSAEKEYYRERVRRETQWRVVRDTQESDPEFHPTRLPPALDAQGHLLPAYQSLYKYLVPYEPFPYGLSPFAIAYNYYRQAQYLQNDEHQEHLQISPSVIDSRPAIALENWSGAERRIGRTLELQLFEKPVPTDPNVFVDLQTASEPVSSILNRGVDVQHIIYAYKAAARLASDAAEAYRVHLKNQNFNSNNLFTFEWHIDHNVALADLSRADADYIQAMVSGGKQHQLLEQARSDYQLAIRDCRIVMFKWFTPDDLLAKLHAQKMKVGDYSNEKLGEMADELHHLLDVKAPMAEGGEDSRSDYERYARRAQLRLAQISKALSGS
ncbi:MAG TPA: hypothetical protein VG722_02760 [Tepidisphaeraceae bacterium]|nr:hypothetical protein [Tepidisphaeraceae bacterium]